MARLIQSVNKQVGQNKSVSLSLSILPKFIITMSTNRVDHGNIFEKSGHIPYT